MSTDISNAIFLGVVGGFIIFSAVLVLDAIIEVTRKYAKNGELYEDDIARRADISPKDIVVRAFKGMGAISLISLGAYFVFTGYDSSSSSSTVAACIVFVFLSMPFMGGISEGYKAAQLKKTKNYSHGRDASKKYGSGEEL